MLPRISPGLARDADHFAERGEHKHIARLIDRIHIVDKSGKADVRSELRGARLLFELGAQRSVARE